MYALGRSRNSCLILFALPKSPRFPIRASRLVEVDDRLVVVFHVGGNFYALDDVCTHDGGPLGEGQLDGFHDRLPAARGQVRHPRRPGADDAGHAADRGPRSESRRRTRSS